MPFHRIHDLIEAALVELPPGPLLVALSGGLDSTTLLHALAASPVARARGLRAVHVDHGLHEDSADWSAHCRDYTGALGVELIIRAVDVPSRRAGLGREASARRARYAAIEALLAPGEIVALAHHRDDQAETVLLKLMRGAGPEGIGAMRTVRRLGPGLAWRPLLGLPRAALREYAEHQQLDWVQDPSNADPTIDRNYLRMQVMPRILQRWPEAEASIAQSAAWARAAASFIDGEAGRALARTQGLDPSTLRLREWLELPQALRDPVLRRWLRSLDLPEPTHYQAAELVRQLGEAGEDRQPCVRWPGAEVRRYRDLAACAGTAAVAAVRMDRRVRRFRSRPADGSGHAAPGQCGNASAHHAAPARTFPPRRGKPAAVLRRAHARTARPVSGSRHSALAAWPLAAGVRA